MIIEQSEFNENQLTFPLLAIKSQVHPNIENENYNVDVEETDHNTEVLMSCPNHYLPCM